jgi:tetratricopeptide (TPR) repeat protein
MRLIAIILFGVILLLNTPSLRAQQVSPSTPPEPPAEPVFDPYHAEKSMEIGSFYMKKGKIDAAIDRFEEAARYQPALARPWKLLGEAYEKKHDYGKAAESYKKYLEVFPGAADAAQIKKRISFVEQKQSQAAAKSAR